MPAGGGCKELLIRLGDASKAFELIGYGKVSTSAEDARHLGLLRDHDEISMNPERLVADAKAVALSLAPGYVAGVPFPFPAEPDMAAKVFYNCAIRPIPLCQSLQTTASFWTSF